MNFKDKLLEQLNREDLSDNEAKVNAIIEAVGEFIPKGKYNALSQRLDSVEAEKQSIIEKYKKDTMTQEELNAQRINEIIKKAEERERLASIKENSAEAKEILIEAGLSKEELKDGLLTAIVSENRDDTLSRANSLAEIFKSQKARVEKDVRDSYYNDNPQPPATDKKDDAVTKEDLAKMTYSEEIAFANANPSLYQELTK